MEVILAGYNIDAEIIAALKENAADAEKQDITPETIAAAYARISRSSAKVNELRLAARAEVEAARRSNENIVFEMGHSSIAEHVVFNIDIIGVSRLLVEEIQHFRLCSFTEKSQRYVTLRGDFTLPPEIAGSPLEKNFGETLAEQNRFYREALPLLTRYIQEKHQSSGAPISRSLGESLAKEDVRYALSLAMHSQMGMTINARNLELMLRRLRALPLQEAAEFADKLWAITKPVAPSLLRYTLATEYDLETRRALRASFDVKTLLGVPLPSSSTKRPVHLVSCLANADNELLASLLFSSAHLPLTACRKAVRNMSAAQKKRVFHSAFAKMNSFDVPLREFENIQLTFELLVSASCFAQLKRHRMASLHCQPYDVALGVRVPPAIVEVGLRKAFAEVIEKSEALYAKLFAYNPQIASYILTNAHRRRVLLTLNARELYHISRLRMDEHAQWDIREIVTEMVRQARRKMPGTLLLAVGKSDFAQLAAKELGNGASSSTLPS